MSKKRLPKAIRSTAAPADADRRAEAAPPSEDQTATETVALQAPPPLEEIVAPPGSPPTETVALAGSPPSSASPSHDEGPAAGAPPSGQVEPQSAPAHAPAPPMPIAPTALPVLRDTDAVMRRLYARRIVNRYVRYSALCGLLPLSVIFDFASVTVIVLQMVQALGRFYGVPLERTRARALVAGMVGGAAAPGLAAVTTAGVAQFVPGANLIGLAVTAAAAAAWTRSIGESFVKLFESGADLEPPATVQG